VYEQHLPPSPPGESVFVWRGSASSTYRPANEALPSGSFRQSGWPL
jgi:hypothetical protein